ncbi:hypothetical protein PN441_00400 [Spirulina major CS-329]|uniref:hypothetical protein n=1 Tax=Spirulina TaxID=1154 RepID=UPI00232D0723|nr:MULTISPECIES: hypothetical protein [Spirulina]MDB9494164.1 hypothetical protein [Spirulina subsalsa CS-330]MDB9501514.1 hypothetical protein [Spirulina major CS-329]
MDEAAQETPVTLVISEVVASDRIAEYEEWTKAINGAARSAPGFVGVEIIRPRDPNYLEYVVIVKFSAYRYLRAWVQSDTYRLWIRRADHLVRDRALQDQPDGIELWFTLPSNRIRDRPQPAYYKKVIIGMMAVYPLILLVDQVVGPFLTGLPPKVALLVSVLFVSALMTYPVMPLLTRWCDRWLYPPVRSR